MSKCPGLHCDGCGHGGGPPGLAVALLIVVVIAAGTAAGHAVWHGIVTALEIAGYTLASVAGLAALGCLSYGGYRVYRWHAARRPIAPARVVSVQIDSPRAGVPGWPVRGALEASPVRPAGWPLLGEWDEAAGGGRNAS
jgi:hypothetical protein